jgi:hypothetical protein
MQLKPIKAHLVIALIILSLLFGHLYINDKDFIYFCLFQKEKVKSSWSILNIIN